MSSSPRPRPRVMPSRWALLLVRVLVRRFGVVEPGLLYRSGQVHRYWADAAFRRLGIRLIVNLTSEGHGDPDKDAEREVAERLGIERRTFHQLGDGTGDPELYRQALELVRTRIERGDAVLVHCAAGAYRTGALVAWYRLLAQRWEPERAFAELSSYGVRRARRERLLAYLTEHLPTVAGPDGTAIGRDLGRAPLDA